MDKETLTPMKMVAREMAEHSSMTAGQIEGSLRRVLNDLRKRAADAIVANEEAPLTLDIAHEYQAVSEMVNFFGSQLIAFEDLDVHDAHIIKN